MMVRFNEALVKYSFLQVDLVLPNEPAAATGQRWSVGARARSGGSVADVADVTTTSTSRQSCVSRPSERTCHFAECEKNRNLTEAVKTKKNRRKTKVLSTVSDFLTIFCCLRLFQVENLQKSLKNGGSAESTLTIQNKLQQVRELEEEVRDQFRQRDVKGSCSCSTVVRREPHKWIT